MNDISLYNESKAQVTNPFPNVRMVVKDGKQLWCLKDFAIAIGFTGNNPSGSALKLLNDVEKRSCSDVEQVQFEGERQVNRKMSYVPIELLNAIINRTTLKTPSVTEWRTKMQQVGGEAVKSQLGIENDIDKMVNERVEKALALQNNNSATMALCNSMTQLIANMQEENRKFQLQLLDRIGVKEKDSRCTKYISDFVDGDKSIAAQLNLELEKAGYLKRVVEGRVKYWDLTDLAKSLNIGKVVEEKHYKTILYNENADCIIVEMIKRVNENNSLSAQ